MPARSVSRRQFLAGAGGAAGALALGGGAFEAVRLLTGAVRPTLPGLAVQGSGAVRSFHSLPDLRPAAIAVSRVRKAGRDRDAPGYMFLGAWSTDGNQSGPQIVERDGELVWFSKVPAQWESNFRTWTYRGQPVLAWWEGRVLPNGYGHGEAVIVDSSYREVARIKPANGRKWMDLHELRLTPEGTALFTCYPEWVPHDLSSIGGPRDGTVIESIFQEVDIRTGRLLLEWRSLDHVPVQDSYRPVTDGYDYIHLNSIDVLPDGNLLVSGRQTWALYKLDRRTGEVIWRLGGKRTQFDIGKDAQFYWQHDARAPLPGTITVFDNGSDGPINTETRSRGMRLDVDYSGRKVRLAQNYTRPTPLLAVAMGNVQLLPNDKVQIGWGMEPFVSEFADDGRLLSDARLLSGYKSYRAYRLPWRARPHYPPAISAHRSSATGKTTLYASWNGATEVSYWQVHGGPRISDLRPLGIAPRRAFETAIPLRHSASYLAVTALDRLGRVLSRSHPIRT